MKKKIMAAVISMALVLACVPAALADCPPHTFDYWVTTLEPTCTHVGAEEGEMPGMRRALWAIGAYPRAGAFAGE